MNSANNSLTIGRLAKAAGVTIETIRYYQEKGLLQQPLKPSRGYRHYPHHAIERLAFIKRAQELGFTLAEIKQLLDLGDGHCQDVQTLAQDKLHNIASRIQDLMSIQKVLTELLEKCRENTAPGSCAIIAALAQPEKKT